MYALPTFPELPGRIESAIAIRPFVRSAPFGGPPSPIARLRGRRDATSAVDESNETDGSDAGARAER